MKDSYPLDVNNETIKSENCLKMLGIKKENTLYFEQHISTPCEKNSNHKNTMGKINMCMGFMRKERLFNNFTLSKFICCPFVWHFCSANC